MHIASVEELSKSYGIRKLFSGISFHISEGDKIALIARNGQGKTSLLNIMASIDTADSGEVWIHKDIPIIYLKQENNFDNSLSIEEQLLEIEHPIIALIKEYEALLRKNDTESEAFEHALNNMNEQNAWLVESAYKEIVGRLKLPPPETKTNILSGGQKKRLALAQALLKAKLFDDKCLFILDEPTNHLDIEMIEWLEQQLNTQKTSLILVSHDRYFIDSVCNTLIEIEDHKAFKHSGNYQTYLENKAHRIEVAASELKKDKNIYRRELDWMRKQPKARTTKSKSREDSFYDIEKKVKTNKGNSQLELNVKMNRLGGKILEMKKVYKSYDDLEILKGFDYTFKKGERIGIVGKNGVGKSTFLKIALQLEQADSGKINHGETVVFGHFSQDGLQWKEDKRVIEYVKSMAEYFPLADGTKISASAFLERFAFPPEQQHTFLSKLSGGEKRRLQLLSILFKNPNFLVLDEPTNDLDLQTLQLLEDFLLNYPGCLLLVSHDRYFMDKLVGQLFVFRGNADVKIFPGNYSQYRYSDEFVSNFSSKKTDTADTASSTQPTETSNQNTSTSSNEPKRQLSYKEKREFEEIEKTLPLLEKEKEALTKTLMQSDLPYDEIEKASKRITEVTEELEYKELRWLEISELIS